MSKKRINKNRGTPTVAFNFKGIDRPIVGFSLEKAKGGSKIKIAQRGFFTDYDGDFFFNCLTQISDIFLSRWLFRGHHESEIQNWAL